MKAPVLAAAPLTVSDVTAPAVLGISGRQFRRLVAERRLPTIRVGRRTVVPAAALLALFSGTAPATELTEDEFIEAAARGRK